MFKFLLTVCLLLAVTVNAAELLADTSPDRRLVTRGNDVVTGYTWTNN